MQENHERLIENSVLRERTFGEPQDWRTASWGRCVSDYKLDPARPAVYQLTSHELKRRQESYGCDLGIAVAEADHVLSMIEEGGYSVHIADKQGTIIAERRSTDSAHYCPADRIGAVWGEAAGGTNGIGTSILEMKPISVYLTDHFFADYTVQACVGAPFFGPNAELLGVINLSTRNSALPVSTQKVVFGVARRAAERLEMRYFEERFRRFHILSVANDGAATAMIAVDEDFCIVGATRAAREQLPLNESAVGSRSLWAVFERCAPTPSFDKLREGIQLRHLANGQRIAIRARAPLEPPLRPSALARQPGRQSRQRPAVVGNPSPTVDECAGQDAKMLGNIGILRRVIGSGLHILLFGETGVGKDTLARALHLESRRSEKAFVAFNCASVPETLVDSELFGYSAGAFTGASREGYVGRVVEADGGTLFLDEIGDMPISLQTRLLRVLESGEVSPLGSTKTRHVDLQVIAATHQNLVERMRDGRFRQDLFYRLAGAVVTIPPLRDRADLQHLIDSVLRQSARGRAISFSAEAMQALIRHEWPGNIRELRNVIQRAIHFALDGVIGTDALDAGGIFLTENRGRVSTATLFEHAVLLSSPPVGAAEGTKEPARREGAPIHAKVAAEDAERQAIANAIEASGRNPTLCAQMLGLSRATLYRKLKRHGLSGG